MNPWKNKHILITGGTSGLGKALARILHEEGARVAIVARTTATLREMEEALPGLVGISADVSRKGAIHPLVAEVFGRLGKVDVLFNGASELGPTPLRLLLDTECEDFEQVLQANLLGPFRLTKAIAPAMVLQGQGLVVNITSDASVTPYPRWGSYAVSKAGLDHLTNIFAEELKDHGIRFHSVDPGDMNTPMHRAAVPDGDFAQLRSPEESARRILEFLEGNDPTVRVSP